VGIRLTLPSSPPRPVRVIGPTGRIVLAPRRGFQAGGRSKLLPIHAQRVVVEPFFSYPPVRETVDATLRESCAARARASASTPSCSTPRATLRSFVEKLTPAQQGPAFFTTPETLGDYVLVDFIEQKRELRRAG
jgi:hypothetical protein